MTLWSYIIVYIGTVINMAFGFHKRNTFFLDKLKAHDFKMRRIIIMHILLTLIYLFSLLISQIINNENFYVFLIFMITYFIVFFYTATGISMAMYNTHMKDGKVKP